MERFEALQPGEAPQVHYGPQGGTHLLLAVRVENPDTEGRSLEIELMLENHADRREAGAGSDAGQTEDEERWYDFYSRRVVLEAPSAAPFEQPALLLSMDTAEEESLLTLQVKDGCGRQATDAHYFFFDE